MFEGGTAMLPCPSIGVVGSGCCGLANDEELAECGFGCGVNGSITVVWFWTGPVELPDILLV